MRLKFYDVKSKKSFYATKYKTVTKIVRGKKRKFAVAKAPSGVNAWRIIA